MQASPGTESKGGPTVKRKTVKAPKKKLQIHRETLHRLALQPDYLQAIRGGDSADNGTCHPSPFACPLSQTGC